MSCLIMHKWGRPKQWQNGRGMVVTPRCGVCGELKYHEPVLVQAPRRVEVDEGPPQVGRVVDVPPSLRAGESNG